MDREPADVVEAGYDLIAERHLAWIDRIEGDPRLRFLDELLDRLPPRPALLDLGCGAGVPCTVTLAERGAVTGVDVSAEQLRLARERVPAGRFIKSDMTQVGFAPGSFDAVTAFYSIAHVPREQHGPLFQRIAGWLRPGGQLLVSLGSESSPDVVDEWLGAPMFFSSHDRATNRRLITSAGLNVGIDEVVRMQEPEGPASFQWVLASKPAPADRTETAHPYRR